VKNKKGKMDTIRLANANAVCSAWMNVYGALEVCHFLVEYSRESTENPPKLLALIGKAAELSRKERWIEARNVLAILVSMVQDSNNNSKEEDKRKMTIPTISPNDSQERYDKRHPARVPMPPLEPDPKEVIARQQQQEKNDGSAAKDGKENLEGEAIPMQIHPWAQLMGRPSLQADADDPEEQRSKMESAQLTPQDLKLIMLENERMACEVVAMVVNLDKIIMDTIVHDNEKPESIKACAEAYTRYKKVVLDVYGATDFSPNASRSDDIIEI